MNPNSYAKRFLRYTHATLFLLPGSLFLLACANGPLPLQDSNKYPDSERNYAGICSSWAHQGRNSKIVGSRFQYRCQHPWSVPPVAAAVIRSEVETQEARPTPAVSAPRRSRLDVRPLLFRFDSAALDDDGQRQLQKAVQWLQQFPDTTLVIDGYTDSTGPATYNQGLSVRRATAAKAFLVEKGIADQRLYVVGHGENDPAASNDSREGRQQNRRSELDEP